MEAITKPLTVTIPQASKMIGVGRTSIYELMAEGKLDSRRIAGRRLVTVSSIERLVDAAA